MTRLNLIMDEMAETGEVYMEDSEDDVDVDELVEQLDFRTPYDYRPRESRRVLAVSDDGEVEVIGGESSCDSDEDEEEMEYDDGDDYDEDWEGETIQEICGTDDEREVSEDLEEDDGAESTTLEEEESEDEVISDSEEEDTGYP